MGLMRDFVRFYYTLPHFIPGTSASRKHTTYMKAQIFLCFHEPESGPWCAEEVLLLFLEKGSILFVYCNFDITTMKINAPQMRWTAYCLGNKITFYRITDDLLYGYGLKVNNCP